MLKQFEAYLENDRKLRSAKKYAGAIRTADRYLLENPWITGGRTLEALSSKDDIERAVSALMKLPDFSALDTRGNQMYSVGLNHFVRFVGINPNLLRGSTTQGALGMLDCYENYLKNDRKLRSSKKYVGAIRTVNRFLKENPSISAGHPIDALGTISAMERAAAAVMALPAFQELDARGNRMYSTALKHLLAYAGGNPDLVVFQKTGTAAPGPAPKPVPEAVVREVKNYPRKPAVTLAALEDAGYRCLRDASHETFPIEGSNHHYMEGHHFIPLSKQEHFQVSLDIVQNIVCLCPTCHRLLHYATRSLREKTFDQIFEVQGERLALAGIDGSRTELREIALS